MSHSEICPACHGTGKKPVPTNWSTINCSWSSVCHGCGGKGWVTVTDSYDYQPVKEPKKVGGE